MRLNQYTIIAIFFLLIIFLVGGITLWQNKGMILRSVVNGNMIEESNLVYSEKIAGFNFFLDVWSVVQSITDTKLLDDAKYGYILKDEEEKLYFPVEKVDTMKQVENIIQLEQALKENNIPFLYVQAPNKVLDGYTEEFVYKYNFANKNADELIEQLEKEEIDVLDLRKIIEKESLKQEELFYKTDHHWTTPTAFWAYQKLVDYLNENYFLKIDEENYYTNKNNFETIIKEKYFLGSLGKRVGKYVSGVDDYIYIKPKFKTDYEIYDMKVSEEKELYSGDFENSIVRKNMLYDEDITTNRYATYFERDYLDLLIRNKKINNDLKILIVKDSYALPVVAFLSTCVEEVRMLDLRYGGNIDLINYIKPDEYDVVIMLYNTESVDNIEMFEFFK